MNGMSSGLVSKPFYYVKHKGCPTKYENALRHLEEWKKQYNLNFTVRRNLLLNISFQNGYLVIGGVHWSLDGMLFDFHENGKNEIDKNGLESPSIKDIDDSAYFMPGNDMNEKRLNLFSLLGFDSSYKATIWIRENNLNFRTQFPGTIIDRVSSRIKSLTGKIEEKEEFIDVLIIDTGKINKSTQNIEQCGYFTPIKK